MKVCFLINTITDWSEPPRARHQVTFELAKKHTVVYINVNHIGIPGFTFKKESRNLSILTPSFPINFKIRYRIPILNEVYQMWLFTFLKNKFPNYQMINFDFSASLINRYFSNYIYYCNDNFTRISKRRNNYFIYKYHENCEKKVISKAMFCIATSNSLREKLLRFNSNVYEISLGGPKISDYGILVNSPIHINSGDKIKLGLLGFVKNSNTSSEIINNILQTGKFELSIIGPVEDQLLKKISYPQHIKLLGILTDKPLYDAINKWDVAIAPYHFDKLDYITPNKLLVYLSLGKPTVITNLRAISIENYSNDLIYFVDSRKDFVETIMKAFSKNNEKLMNKRIAFAEENTWEKKIDYFLQIYRRSFSLIQLKDTLFDKNSINNDSVLK